MYITEISGSALAVHRHCQQDISCVGADYLAQHAQKGETLFWEIHKLLMKCYLPKGCMFLGWSGKVVSKVLLIHRNNLESQENRKLE